MTIKRIDHIAIVVPGIEEARAIYERALGLTITHVEDVPEQEVTVAFLPVGESHLELVQPTSDVTGVARFLAQRGGGIHHICLQVDDIEAALARMAAQGLQLINEEPVIGAGGRRVAFVHPKSTYGVLIELVEGDHP